MIIIYPRWSTMSSSVHCWEIFTLALSFISLSSLHQCWSLSNERIRILVGQLSETKFLEGKMAFIFLSSKGASGSAKVGSGNLIFTWLHLSWKLKSTRSACSFNALFPGLVSPDPCSVDWLHAEDVVLLTHGHAALQLSSPSSPDHHCLRSIVQYRRMREDRRGEAGQPATTSLLA